jgi:hypothetical protein
MRIIGEGYVKLFKSREALTLYAKIIDLCQKEGFETELEEVLHEKGILHNEIG